MGFVMLIVQIILSTVLPVWTCLWITRQVKRQLSSKSKLADSIPDTHFLLKRFWALWSISKKARSGPSNYVQVYRSVKYVQPHSEKPRSIKTEDSCTSMLFYGADQQGNSLFVKFAALTRGFAEITLQLVTGDKRIYVLPDHPATIVSGSPSDKWSAVGLKIELLQAQHRWRITYNGFLRNITEGEHHSRDNVEHVRLNCIFVTNSNPLEWPGDWSHKLHADAIAHEPWRSPQWINKIKLLDYTGVDQFGSIFGQVTFQDSTVSTLYLRGLRQPRWGKHESHEFHKAVVFYGVMKNGIIFHVGAGSTKHSFKRLQFGQLKHSNEQLRKVEWMDFELSDFNEENCTNTERTLRFNANGWDYNVRTKFNNATTFFTGQSSNWATRFVTLNLEIDGWPGIGLMQLWYPHTGHHERKVRLPKLQYARQPSFSVKKDDYIMFFDEERCQNESLVGGKGFSLAVLTSIKNASFVVPEGFCVTAVTFEQQVESRVEIAEVIQQVVAVSSGKKDGDLEKLCEKAMQIIGTTGVAEPLRIAILKAVERLESKGGKFRYAVRSSAVGEDSEETSAAGQNSTYLGISGADSVVRNVALCWASLYSYQSVQYRRQHGLAVKAAMGVCVQRMVDAEAAGVMFTRHPTTGDPSDIIITANYGLGESVVSAMVEPDTITVHRSWDNKLSIKDSVVGNKTQKILMNGDGVATANLEEREAQQVSITEQTALELASIGLDLELLFGTPRDIEWAVAADKIFLLQARPITTLNTWTDFELTHELDTTVPSDIDLMTFANVGEVFPYPVSPLGISVVLKDINEAMGFQQGDTDPSYLGTTSMRCTINYYSSMMQVVEKEISIMKKVADIALCGKVIVTPEIHKTAHQRNGPFTASQNFFLLYEMAKGAWLNSSVEKQTLEFNKRYMLDTDDYHTASTLFAKINSKIDDLYQIALFHGHTSRVSVTYQIMAMTLLMKGYDDFVPDHFRDIALLLSSCSEAVSTAVPLILGQTAKLVRKCGKAEEFSKVDPANAISWLREHCPPAAEKVDALFKEHGYRCIQELDFLSDSWSSKPESLIETIQAICVSTEEPAETKQLSAEETIAGLKTPTSATTRFILKKLVPVSRKAVARRELTKSVIVSVIHSLKLAYRRLATFLVHESYLPSEHLIFFLTHQEIGDLLNARNPSLVQKAFRRSRIYPRLAQLKYPELNQGMPIPLKASFDVTIREGCPKLQGTSVCGGSILGRACVITDLSQAKEIKSGDILITLATDIGWSPYFPLLGGIVTELGGLISHGAVVAREYGLPCIVGAKGATEIFQTGDTVLLVADTGVLQMLQKV